MARLLVRDRATREFEIDETALPFWEGRVEVLGRIPDIGDEPNEAEVVGSPPEPSDPKPSSKAASRSAENKRSRP